MAGFQSCSRATTAFAGRVTGRTPADAYRPRDRASADRCPWQTQNRCQPTGSGGQPGSSENRLSPAARMAPCAPRRPPASRKVVAKRPVRLRSEQLQIRQHGIRQSQPAEQSPKFAAYTVTQAAAVALVSSSGHGPSSQFGNEPEEPAVAPLLWQIWAYPWDQKQLPSKFDGRLSSQRKGGGYTPRMNLKRYEHERFRPTSGLPSILLKVASLGDSERSGSERGQADSGRS